MKFEGTKFFENNFDVKLADSEGIEWECELTVYVKCSRDNHWFDYTIDDYTIEGRISNGAEIRNISIGTKNDNKPGYFSLDDNMIDFLIEMATEDGN